MAINLSKALLIYTIIICSITLSKRYLPDPRGSKSNHINECQRCKVLTDSVHHWLDKTSRGKFEGGDAAWEETKLKSYARSEIRLVEVQEGLCSELKKHQDQCYSLAEEAEHVLEKWWFHEDPDAVDLHTWLCIETLHYCCPQNHFGESCSLCPQGRNKEMCSGQGRCDGEGTRNGNGSCICKHGFTGQYCENCANNFYSVNTECVPCHKACDGCSGEGDTACDSCQSGWEMEDGVCLDVNECANPSSCKSNQYCVNREGSHSCKACDKACNTCEGKGPSNCTSCDQGSVLWSGVCVDETMKKDILSITLKRAALYLGLLLITFFVFRKSKPIASTVILLISVYIYFLESYSKMNIIDVISKMYF